MNTDSKITRPNRNFAAFQFPLSGSKSLRNQNVKVTEKKRGKEGGEIATHVPSGESHNELDTSPSGSSYRYSLNTRLGVPQSQPGRVQRTDKSLNPAPDQTTIRRSSRYALQRYNQSQEETLKKNLRVKQREIFIILQAS